MERSVKHKGTIELLQRGVYPGYAFNEQQEDMAAVFDAAASAYHARVMAEKVDKTVQEAQEYENRERHAPGRG